MSNKTRVKRALDIALERIYYILDYYTAPDFIDITGTIGGDVTTYCIYDDGSIYER